MTERVLDPATCFVVQATDRTEMFTKVYQQLFEQGLVANGFLEEVIQREEDYPTGLDSRNLGAGLPNLAFSHTEGCFVKKQRIVPIRLLEPIVFKSMVNPEQELPVGFCFMLLDQKADGQAELLAKTMTFLSQADPADLRQIFAQTDPASLYSALREAGF
ncbi:PTS sugar transporter subunit IIA [Lactobacillus porci]|uniref:PTS sugar transporter subunit IIA n=1 Tax=Lactobacillus porci TaxID=2012477 RepID=UPI0039923652